MLLYREKNTKKGQYGYKIVVRGENKRKNSRQIKKKRVEIWGTVQLNMYGGEKQTQSLLIPMLNLESHVTHTCMIWTYAWRKHTGKKT